MMTLYTKLLEPNKWRYNSDSKGSYHELYLFHVYMHLHNLAKKHDVRNVSPQSAKAHSRSPALTSNSSLVDSIFTRTVPRSHSEFPTNISLLALILSACLNTLVVAKGIFQTQHTERGGNAIIYTIWDACLLQGQLLVLSSSAKKQYWMLVLQALHPKGRQCHLSDVTYQATDPFLSAAVRMQNSLQ